MIWLICKDEYGYMWLARAKSRKSAIEFIEETFATRIKKCRQLHYSCRDEFVIRLNDLCKDITSLTDRINRIMSKK